jgi:G:T-mismatch repair DNA endonuclease (very short patch repair protein)
MVDHLTPSKRSWNMSRIRSSNTKPEKIVRSLLFAMGYRFRLPNLFLKGIAISFKFKNKSLLLGRWQVLKFAKISSL